MVETSLRSLREREKALEKGGGGEREKAEAPEKGMSCAPENKPEKSEKPEKPDKPDKPQKRACMAPERKWDAAGEGAHVEQAVASVMQRGAHAEERSASTREGASGKEGGRVYRGEKRNSETEFDREFTRLIHNYSASGGGEGGSRSGGGGASGGGRGDEGRGVEEERVDAEELRVIELAMHTAASARRLVSMQVTLLVQKSCLLGTKVQILTQLYCRGG